MDLSLLLETGALVVDKGIPWVSKKLGLWKSRVIRDAATAIDNGVKPRIVVSKLKHRDLHTDLATTDFEAAARLVRVAQIALDESRDWKVSEVESERAAIAFVHSMQQSFLGQL